MCPPNFEASTPFIHGCLAKYGQKWRTIGPKAGKRTHTAGLLYISGRYDVYVACGFLLQFGSCHTESMGAGINGPKGGRAPCNLPICNGMGKDYHCTQTIPTTHPHHTAAPTNVIFDLGDGTEDSEYKEFDDELDV